MNEFPLENPQINLTVFANVLSQQELYNGLNEETCISKLKKACESPYYEYQLGFIIILGGIYLKKQEFLNASAIYNYALNICFKVLLDERLFNHNDLYLDIIAKIKKELIIIEKQLVHFIIDRNAEDIFSYENVNKHHKMYLMSLRKRCANKVKEIETAYDYDKKLISEIPSEQKDEKILVRLDLRRAEEIKMLYEDIAKDIKVFIKKLIEECMHVLGEAPCDFAIVGLGSLARSAMTPFSDFEFCILIEDMIERLKVLNLENYEQKGRVINEKNKEYFRKLTILLHFKVINLGETILPSMAIRTLNDYYANDDQKNWFYDYITPRGFAFDGLMPGACKYPLGEKKSDGSIKYELIQTPQCMAEFHDIKNDQMLNGKLSTLLVNSVCIYGDEKLFTTYHEVSAQILKTEVQRESVKLFYMGDDLNNEEKKDLIRNKKLDMTTSLKKIAEEKLAIDLHDFNPDINSYIMLWKEGFDVKKEFYRFITQIIEDLALTNEVIEPNIWKKLRILFDKDFLTKNAYNNLKIVLSLVLYLRLKIYLIYNKQSERFLINDTSEKSHLISFNIEYFSKIYCTYIPLHQAAIEYCGNIDIISVYPKATDEQMFRLEQFLSKFKATEITDTSYKLGHRINIDSMYENTEFVQGIIWIKLNKYNEAKKCFLIALELKERKLLNSLNEFHRNEILHKVIDILDKLGFIEGELGNKLQSYNYHKQVLQRSGELRQSKSSLANDYNNLGVAARECNNLSEAYEYHMKALALRLEIKSPEAAASYNNLAKIFEKQNKVADAISYLEKAKSILIETNQTKNDIYGIVCINLRMLRMRLQQEGQSQAMFTTQHSVFANNQSLSMQNQEPSPNISVSSDNDCLNLRKGFFLKK